MANPFIFRTVEEHVSFFDEITEAGFLSFATESLAKFEETFRNLSIFPRKPTTCTLTRSCPAVSQMRNL